VTALPQHAGRIWGLGVLALVFVWLAFRSWLKWPDLLVDFGRELYVPWRLVEGDVLYRDIAYFNGPLSPYWNALGFWLFGPGMSTLFGINLALTALIAAGLYRWIERGSDSLTATLAASGFVGVFAFGHLVAYGNYNFVAPYSHELVHGFALSVCALALTSRSFGSDATAARIGSGVLLGLVFLTKAELFLAAGLAVAACGLLGLNRGGTSRAQTSRWILTVACAAMAPVVIAALALSLAMSGADTARAIVGSWPGVLAGDAASLQFYRHWMGVDDAAGNLAAMLFEFGLLGGAVCVALGAERFVRRLPGSWSVVVAFVLSAAALLLAAPDWLRVGRSLPLIAVLGAVLALRRWRRADGVDTSSAASFGFGFAVFAVTSLAKMLLFARVFHYGFVLAAPAALIAVVVGMRWLPDELQRRGAGGGPVFRAIVAAWVVVATLGYIAISESRYRTRTEHFGAGADVVAVRPVGPSRLAGRAAVLTRALERLDALPADATLLVLPEGVMINYLTRRPTPTPYINFLPPELLLFGEEPIIAALDRSRPDAVMLVHKDTSEYGFPRFGRDYGRALMDWVRANYAPEGPAIGDPPLRDGSRFGMAIWRPRG
jgi:hypothetical protein